MSTLWWYWMAIIRKESKYNVVQMAEKRVKNIFSNGLPVYRSFSGGKDSLALATLVYNLIQRGEIDSRQLIINYCDEEAIYPCIERTIKEWRKKFMMVGAKFNWYCLEIRHFNALNKLTTDESFICWDRFKSDVWVRKKPPYAINYHPLFKPRKDTYQQFLARIEADGLTITGVRVYESMQRLINFSRSTSVTRQLQPIYDWKDSDVWLYLLENDVKIPEAYMHMYQTGKSKGEMRISMFFSSDTVGSLVTMNQYYPDLMNRIIKREPNAYLVSLYWDSEMFKKNTRRRKKLEVNEEKKNYRDEVMKLLSDINKNFDTVQERELAREYRKVILQGSLYMQEKHYKTIYESMLVGDPYKRTLRAIRGTIFDDARKRG